jgi:hypothetical protein
MASNINTSGINISYPIAGQDNDTQGFRDNFSSIKYNFTTAAAEISGLQANVVAANVAISSLQSAVNSITGFDTNILPTVVGIQTNVSVIQGQLSSGSINTTGNISANTVTLASALHLANLSTATRDTISATNGMLIYNNTYNKFQGYANGAWGNITLS